MLRRIFPALLVVLLANISAHAAANSQAVVPNFMPNGLYADFDGDLKLEHLQIQRSFLQIQRGDGSELRLGVSRESHWIGFEFASIDLDGDKDLDIVVQNRLLGQPAGIWINNGSGSFTESTLWTVPSSFEHRSWWIAANNEETEDLIGDEQFKWIVCLPSAELPSRSTLTLTWHVVSTWNVLRGYDETFHLRGPPSLSFV
jgi:hypothetical protein